jgi:Ser/Thr protein kinase RdoA (MazF antagonist)
MSMLDSFHHTARQLPQRPGFRSAVDLLVEDQCCDIDLRSMPDELVERCRNAWKLLIGMPRTIIHGDINPSNILVTREGRVALVDWDESRRDVPQFDRYSVCRDDPTFAHTALAWEIASCWAQEPERARRLVGSL